MGHRIGCGRLLLTRIVRFPPESGKSPTLEWSIAVLLAFLIVTRIAMPGSQSCCPSEVYHGFRQETQVQIPRFANDASIDGSLNEEEWQRAAVLTGFSQYSPVDGVPASDSTEVLLWYSDDALHVGIRAFEPHGELTPRLSDRDRIQNDDHIQILLDPFNDGRRAVVFGVNPLGVQSDGVRTEAVSRGGGLTSTGESDPVDLSPDFIYESSGRVTDWGYEVEMRIPFQSLRFPNREEQVWGINVIRRVQHSGQTQTWAPARRGRSSFLAQSGTMRGLAGIQGRQVLDINPTLTSQLDGARVGDGWGYGAPSQEVGATMHWGLTSNLTLSATANPDFSQIEADAGQLSFDPRRAVFTSEKRPFFLEGSERFEVPSRLIYTRRIVSPDAALKLAGKLGDWNLGLLTAVDARSASEHDTQALAQVVRVQRDIGEESTAGFVYTDRREGGFSSQLLGADARVNFRQNFVLSMQTATSVTAREGVRERGSLWDVGFQRNGRAWNWDVGAQTTDPGLVAANGFLSRVNTAQLRGAVHHTRYGDQGARVESWTRGVSGSANWLREGLFGSDRHIDDWKTSLVTNAVLSGGWRVGASLLFERFFFPDYLYEDYAIEHRTDTGLDTIPFIGVPSITNYDLVLRLATPRFSRFSGNLSYIVGLDENFDEWARGFINVINGQLEWRPNDQIRIEPSYILQHYRRPGDWSTVAFRSTPRLKAEYQVTRAIFLRLVGQRQAQYRDALRDDAGSNEPILIRNAEGVYVRTEQIRSNGIRVDWLFSFQPSPGTVIFAGYGTDVTERERLRFRDIERVNDQFFVKLSYLFRH